MRLLQVIPTLFPGGLERVAANLTLGVAPHVERLVVCTSGGEPHASRLRASGIELAPMARPWPRPVPLTRAAFGIARVLGDLRPDVIHAHNPAAAAAAALARRLARQPGPAIVTTYHGVLPHRLGRAGRALGLSSDLVVGVGPTSTRALVDAGFAEERTRTIYNSVNARVTRSRGEVRAELHAEGMELIVCVARYVPEKNHGLLLEALKRLDRPYRALLVGDGPLEGEVRARVEALGLAGRVTVAGVREDVIDLMAAADVLVLTSLSEGLPLVLLEAMSVGTPVVATAVGGIGDIVEDGRTGLLVPLDADALAAALARVLDDRSLAAALREAGRRAVTERCSPAAMVEDYLAVYEEAAALRAATRTPRSRAR